MNTAAVRATLKQRADYTYRFNSRTGRHGWLRLTPAYSVKIVEELVSGSEEPVRILDPFCGTATTALSASYHGHEGVTTDINPFLIWLGKAKTDVYSDAVIAATSEISRRAVQKAAGQTAPAWTPPPIHNIERWWSPEALSFLCRLGSAIEALSDEGSQARTLLLVGFCRTLISSSNAAFNHQSMSFKDASQLDLNLGAGLQAAFLEDMRVVLAGAAENPAGKAQVLKCDARALGKAVQGKFDRVITSPPYANRMSYIRELRPYMYWLGYLVEAREAGELDWQAIGGTWGIATSRLGEWSADSKKFKSKALELATTEIRKAENKSSGVLATYVEKYFYDTWLHIQSLQPLLAMGADLHYIVGNSTFYGTLLPVEQIYAAMFSEIGCENVQCIPIRKRNSKKELIEFNVTSRWP